MKWPDILELNAPAWCLSCIRPYKALGVAIAPADPVYCNSCATRAGPYTSPLLKQYPQSRRNNFGIATIAGHSVAIALASNRQLALQGLNCFLHRVRWVNCYRVLRISILWRSHRMLQLDKCCGRLARHPFTEKCLGASCKAPPKTQRFL